MDCSKNRPSPKIWTPLPTCTTLKKRSELLFWVTESLEFENLIKPDDLNFPLKANDFTIAAEKFKPAKQSLMTRLGSQRRQFLHSQSRVKVYVWMLLATLPEACSVNRVYIITAKRSLQAQKQIGGKNPPSWNLQVLPNRRTTRVDQMISKEIQTNCFKSFLKVTLTSLVSKV